MADMLILAALGIAAFLVIRARIRRIGKGGCSACGGCSGCSGCAGSSRCAGRTECKEAAVQDKPF